MARRPDQLQRKPRNTLAQIVGTFLRSSFVRPCFDRRSPIPLALLLGAASLLVLFAGVGLIGIRPSDILARVGVQPPAPPQQAIALPQVNATCAEQSLMRDKWTWFSKGLRSAAPSPWVASPAEGMFAILSSATARELAYGAVEELRNDPAHTPAVLAHAAATLREASGVLHGRDRGVVQYHWGLALSWQGASVEAAQQFKAVEDKIDATLKQTDLSPDSRTRLEGVRIANEHAWGVALLEVNPALAAQRLEQAEARLSKGSASRALVAGPEYARSTLFPLRQDSLVNLNAADIYTDAIAAHIRALAAAKCGDSAQIAALASLRADIAPFRGNAGLVADWPALSANLQLAGALLGDDVFVEQFPALSTSDEAAKASNAAQTVARGDDPTATEGNESGAVWARIKRWRGYLYSGDAEKLHAELQTLPTDDPDTKALQSWLNEMVEQARKTASKDDARQIWRGYGDLTKGTADLEVWRLQSPFGLVIGSILVGLLVVVLAAIWITAFRIRGTYRRLFVSEHFRERGG